MRCKLFGMIELPTQGTLTSFIHLPFFSWIQLMFYWWYRYPRCSQTDERLINHILSYTFRDSAPSERSRMKYLLADIQPVARFFYFFFFPPATSSFIPSKACLYFRLNSSLALPTFVSSTAIFLPIRSLLTTSSLNQPAWRCV